LGNGTVISMTVSEIRMLTIPATSFAENIERLNQMWDDTSTHWQGDSVLKIDGNAIALIHWPAIFKTTGVWSAHKSTWGEWKFLVERYRSGTPAEFWAYFSTPQGDKMSYTAICTVLRDERKASDEELAQRARLEYGDEFEVKFSYRSSKMSRRVVMTNASAIAKEYKRLRNL
ncbi:hypothetical protein R3P38DRAFT_2587441, partial [Favolaschia claudopus]